MTRTSGNNAIKNSNLYEDVNFGVCGKGAKQTRTVKFASTKKPRAVKMSPKINKERIKDESRIQKKFARKRFFKFACCIVMIGLVTFSFIGVLSRYANILQMHYGNLILEREIKEINVQSDHIREELVHIVDPNMIRKLAINEYGMREPAKSQKVKVDIPNGDRVLFSNANVATTDPLEKDYDSLFQNLEGFFKTMR